MPCHAMAGNLLGGESSKQGKLPTGSVHGSTAVARALDPEGAGGRPYSPVAVVFDGFEDAAGMGARGGMVEDGIDAGHPIFGIKGERIA